VRLAIAPLVALLAALALGLAEAARAADAEPTAVALLPLLGDVDADERASIEAALRGALDAVPGVALQPRAQTAASLATAADAGVGCSFEGLSCQANMGLLAGVAKIVVARARAEWASSRVELRVLDVVAAQVDRETAIDVPKEQASLALLLRGAALSLFAPEQTGALLVVAEPRAVLFLDGVELRAERRAKPIEGLAPGEHTVELRAEGPPTRVVANVVAGEMARLEVPTPAGEASTSVDAAPEGSSLGLGAILAISGGAVMVGAGAGAGVVALVLEQPVERDPREALRFTGVALLATGLVGAAVGAAGVGLMLGAGL